MKKLLFSILMIASTIGINAETNVSTRRGNGPENHPQDKHEWYDKHGRHKCPPYIATPEQVELIVSHLKSISFDDERFKIAKLCVQICPLNTLAIGRMAKQFSFDTKRGEFIEFAYVFCIDKEYYYQLRDVFTFKSEAEKTFKKLNISAPNFD